LEAIEHHIKYKDPSIHKSEVLKLLDMQSSIQQQLDRGLELGKLCNINGDGERY
jgi:hypothetical protein